MQTLTEDEIRWVRDNAEAMLVRNAIDELLSLRQQLADAKFYIGAEQYRSDFQTAGQMRAELDRVRQQLADVTKEIGGLRHDLEIAHDHRRIAEQGRDRLRDALHEASGIAVAIGNDRDKCRDKLADYESAVATIMSEPCDESERHCTCVPSLRIEVERLRTELAAVAATKIESEAK